MARTELRSEQLRDGEGVKRADLCTSVSGSAVIAKLVASSFLGLSSTGADAGTGDVTPDLKNLTNPGVLLYDASGNPTHYTGGSTGQVLTKQSNGTWAAETPSGGGIGSKASMTSSQAFSSTTLANVTSLSLSVSANTIYWMMLRLSIVGSASATGIKLGWTFPSGLTMLWNGMYDLNTGGGLFSYNSDPNFATYATGLSESATFTATNDTTTRPLLIGGIVHVGGTAGTLQLQAARYAGSGTATINKGILTLL